MVSAKITYSMILNAFKKAKYIGIEDLLGKDNNEKITVTKSPKVIQKIYDFLKNNLPKEAIQIN